jgi:hypothetical protein
LFLCAKFIGTFSSLFQLCWTPFCAKC